MIVIYTQDKTLIHKNAESAEKDIIALYGAKIGHEAYCAVKGKPKGTSYRKYGGPLITVVNDEKAEYIRRRETEIGMIRPDHAEDT